MSHGLLVGVHDLDVQIPRTVAGQRRHDGSSGDTNSTLPEFAAFDEVFLSQNATIEVENRVLCWRASEQLGVLLQEPVYDFPYDLFQGFLVDHLDECEYSRRWTPE